jgi:exopolysaccharide biosynthesis polyprenyl glycosylphosphotransferase
VQEAQVEAPIRLHEAPAEISAPAAPERSRTAIEVRTSRRRAQLIASVGRAAALWLPVYALLAGHLSSFAEGVAAAVLVTAVFVLAQRGCVAAARLTVQACGPGMASALGVAVGLLGVSALNVWAPGLQLSPVLLLELAGAVFLASTVWERVVDKSIVTKRRVLIVGAGPAGSELAEELELSGNTYFDVVGFVDDDRDSETVAGLPLHGKVADLQAIIASQKPDIVVLAVAQNRLEVFKHLLGSAGSGFRVAELSQFYEQAFGRVPVRHLTAAWFMSVLHLYQRPYTRIAKRAFDTVVASIGLILTAPLMPVIALLVRRTPGPIIFRQNRLGEGGNIFTIYKFRTMRENAEEDGIPLWAEEEDPRVTRTGRFLRRTRLDELPQLWNVLKGDMSIVGPRPERPEFYEQLEDKVPFWSRRHLVKPGITGWAQVRRGYTSDSEGTAEKLSFDLWYLRHRSLLVDLTICGKTFLTLIDGDGAR